MLSKLKALHKCGIVVCDVHADQWVDGVLVDFSTAMTIPHVYGPGGALERPSWTFASLAAWDLRRFQDDVIDEWNEIDWAKNYPRVTPPKRKCKLGAYVVQKNQGPILRRRPLLESTAASVAEQQGEWMRERLRPRPVQHGPYLPLLNNAHLTLDLLELPPYDPAKFDWMALEATIDASGRREKKMDRRGADVKSKV
ncbi:uncharacterized protein DNG_05258 [Cephalotrichum gorgonifer]|uniref:Uncharacterized protein n=1 Tax=Cephalotrichum gorgonifer TaxID=2041049 RepID=A0AAE8MY30_9PEZI|nr:uncharacterized protein DNG_05258 [Cephalotrichum gorgonifer]